MEFNFVLPKKVKPSRETIERPGSQVVENLVWKLISYFFQLSESYEIKFPTKISSFTVLVSLLPNVSAYAPSSVV